MVVLQMGRSARLGLLGVLGALGTLTVGGCRAGCSSEKPLPRPVAGALAWFPAETQIVLSMDFSRLRTTPLWTRLAALAHADPDDQALIADIAKRTGFDPMRQIDSISVAFPEEARTGGAMGLVMRGRGLDEARLVAYVRDQVKKQGDDLFSFRRDGRTLWATRKQPTVAGFFADERTFILGAGGWAEKMAELGRVDGSGAELNPQLVRLVERADVTSSLWAAAIVPAATRAALAADPALTTGGGISRLALGVDIGAGLQARLIADLSTREQADMMAQQVTQAVRAAKQTPQILLMGVGPYLDGITARSLELSTEIAVKLSNEQLNDSVDRLRAFLTLARQAPIPGFPGAAKLGPWK